MSNAKLPHVKSQIPQDLRFFIDRLRDVLGGTGFTKLLTVGDLVSSGLASTNSAGFLSPVAKYLATPPAPTNVEASAAIRNVIVTWGAPAYAGHAYAEVWGASANTFSSAVLLGLSPGAIYVDALGPSATRYYWVRFVNTQDTPGSYNATEGTSATTGGDIAYILGVLSGAITDSQLSTALNSRIDLIDGDSATVGTIPYYLAQVQGQIDAINSYPDYDAAAAYAINDIVKYDSGLYKATAATTGNLPTNTSYWVKIGDYTSIADAVVSIASDVSQLLTDLGAEVTSRETLAAQMRGTYTGTDITSITAGLLFSERTARATADSSLASQISTVSATASGKNTIYRQTTAPTSPAVNDIWVDTRVSYAETYFDTDFSVPKYKQYQWDGSAWLDITDTDVSDNFAIVSREQLARADADSALAQDILTLGVRVNGDIATLNATLVEDYYTAADTNSAISVSSTFLRAYADVASKVFRQASAPTNRGTDPETSATLPLRQGDAWVDTDDSNKLYLWSGTAWVYSPDGVIQGAITAVDARVTNVETAQIGYCTLGGVATDSRNKTACEASGGTWNVGIPFASAVKQVSISDGDESIALEQRFTAQRGVNEELAASYTVKIDDNGSVSGIGLFSEAGQSKFIASVDQFGVEAPLTSVPVRANSTAYTVHQLVRLSTNNSKVLVCKSSGTTGTTAPSLGAIGTMLADGSAQWQIASRVPFAVQATPANINNVVVPAGVYVDAAYIVNATINGAQIGNAAIDNTKIADVNVGKLTAGSLSTDTYIRSSNYVAGTQGFNINADGTAEFSNAVVRGSVYATTGVFSGDISGANGTFSGALDVKSSESGERMEITSASIKVFDSSGVLRVKIGDLSS